MGMCFGRMPYLWKVTDSMKAYRAFANGVQDLPVFVQPWYLDAVASNRWGAAVVERGGQPAAVQPWFAKRLGPWNVIAMPPLCKFMGPYFAPPFRSVRSIYKLSDQLIQGLPRHALFRQNFHYSYTNWLPYYWKGFRQTTRYSYVLENIQDLTAVRANFSTDYRNNKIPKAEQVVGLVDDLQSEHLHRLLEMTYARQSMKSGISSGYIDHIYSEADRNQAGKLLFALDRKGDVHAGLFMLRDRDTAYLLLAADDPRYRQHGAGVWLIWQAIRFAAEAWKVSRFDFLGSVKQSIEQSRRQFGGQAVPYHAIERFNSRMLFAIEWMRGRV